MLQLKNIVKTYVTGDLEQKALKGVSISFREMNLFPFWDRAVREKLLC